MADWSIEASKRLAILAGTMTRQRYSAVAEPTPLARQDLVSELSE